MTREALLARISIDPEICFGKPRQQDLLHAARTLLRGLKRDSLAGRLWIVSRGRIREYEPDN